MKKIFSSLLIAGTLALIPAYIIEDYTEKRLDGSFVKQFRVQGIGYPYNTVGCKANADSNKPRECAGWRAQSKFARTFAR